MILRHKHQLEPSTIETNNFPSHFVVRFHVGTDRSIHMVNGIHLTKSIRSCFQCDVYTTIIITDVITFFVRSIGRSWCDDTHVFAQSGENINLDVRRVDGTGSVDDHAVLVGDDKRLFPFLVLEQQQQ